MKYILLMVSILVINVYANSNKTLNVVLGVDKPPFIFGKSTKKGIEADIVKEALALVGYNLKITQKPKSYLQSILHKQNNIDAVGTISQKDDELFYSEPFISYENYVITRKDSNLIVDNLNDLTSIQFVTWNGAYNDLGDKFYKYFNPITGIFRYSYNDNFSQKDDVEMFFSGKVDAIIIDKTIFNWYKIHLKNKDEYTFHNIFPKKKTYPMTFRSKRVRDAFNIGLNKLKENGRYDQIIKFYQTQDMEEMILYAKLLANISSQYLFEYNPQDLKSILNKFLLHPEIEAIEIKDKKSNSVFLKLKNQDYENNNISTITQSIVYKDKDEALLIGELIVYYKNSYHSNNGVLFPTLESLKTLSKEQYISVKQNYDKLKLDSNNNIILTKQEQQYILKHKTITVHNESMWAPYNFSKNDIPKGFIIDYMDLLAKKLNINIKYISGYSWSEFVNLLKTEKLDVIANITNTKERRKYINFTTPFLTSKKAIFANIPNLKKLSDLNGKTVAVPKEFYIEKYLREHYPKIHIKTFKNTQECLYAIVNKQADALVENYAVVNYLIIKNGLNIKYITINNDKELMTNLSIGVRKSQPILRDILQKAQNSIGKEEFDKLEDKWFGINNTKTEIYSEKEKDYLKLKKTLRICTNPSWAPIEFVEYGKPKGITIDIINIVASKLGLETKYIMTKSWKESQKFLKKKRCDILASAVETTDRKRYASFTKPYLIYDLAIITTKDKPLVDNLAYIVDKPMVRKAASGISMILKQSYPNIRIKDTKTMSESLQKVNDKEVYFTIATLPVLAYNSKRENLNNIQVSGYSKLRCKLSVAVRDDAKPLLSAIDKTLALIPQDTIKVINDKWTTQDIIKKVDYTLVWIVMLVSLIIIVIILYFYKKQLLLKKEIDNLNLSLTDRVKEEIAKNKAKEKLMLQQSRLAQMGEIISMIAHQWRQPLNSLSILNQSVILKYSRDKLNDEFVEYFKINSKKQIQSMSDTIDDFRDFFKPEKEKVEFCVNDVIEHTIDMVRPIYTKEHIAIKFDFKAILHTNGYPNEFGQAILNIINNAKDALIEKKIENKCVKIKLELNDGAIQLMISDNAGGIPDDIIEKIFDPYFSTKNEKNGTGLGLYMTKMIIQEHMDGDIKVYNKADGVVFNIIL